MDIGGLLWGGHKCSRYEPKGAKKGDTYTCVCGAKYECTRTFPWHKWKNLLISR